MKKTIHGKNPQNSLSKYTEFMYHQKNQVYINRRRAPRGEVSYSMKSPSHNMLHRDGGHTTCTQMENSSFESFGITVKTTSLFRFSCFTSTRLHTSLKPETRKFTQSKYDINLKLINSKCELPIIQLRSVRKV